MPPGNIALFRLFERRTMAVDLQWCHNHSGDVERFTGTVTQNTHTGAITVKIICGCGSPLPLYGTVT